MADAHHSEEKLGPVAVKRLIRKRIRRRGEEQEINFLNITAMMDMMTIILVYLLKQFSQTAAVTSTAEIQLPYSNSPLQSKQAINVAITRTQILVEDREVVALRDGNVDASDKQGGANSYLITNLLQTMTQHRDRLKSIAARNRSQPFEGEVTIAAERTANYRLLTEVLYTVGQAEFGRYRLVVLKRTD